VLKPTIKEVFQWCQSHNLLLNIAKTKEIIFNFRHCDITHEHPMLNNNPVEICEPFKYGQSIVQ